MRPRYISVLLYFQRRYDQPRFRDLASFYLENACGIETSTKRMQTTKNLALVAFIA